MRFLLVCAIALPLAIPPVVHAASPVAVRVAPPASAHVAPSALLSIASPTDAHAVHAGPPTDALPSGQQWNGREQDCTKAMWLPRATRKTLDVLYYRLYKDYTDLIDTYARAGALTPAQRDTRRKMLKNYINTFYNRNYQWCSEHERDEWEEEWYNND